MLSKLADIIGFVVVSACAVVGAMTIAKEVNTWYKAAHGDEPGEQTA